MTSLPIELASAASPEIRSLRTENGLLDPAGPGAIASRKAWSSIPMVSALPADSCTAGIATSARGATIGLATTTPAVTSDTPVVRIGPITLRTRVTAFPLALPYLRKS